MEVWNFGSRTLSRFARGWASNGVSNMNREEVELALEYSYLETEMENRTLTDSELARFRKVAKDLENIWALEEIKAG